MRKITVGMISHFYLLSAQCEKPLVLINCVEKIRICVKQMVSF